MIKYLIYIIIIIRKIRTFFYEQKNIVIIDIDNIGDILLTTPMLKKLKLKYSNYKLSYICCPFAKNILIKNKNVDKIIIYDAYSSKLSKLIFFIRIFAKFDISIAIATVDKTANFVNLCSILSGSSLSIGKKIGKLNEYFTKYIILDEEKPEYIGKTYCDIIKGVNFNEFIPEFHIPEKEIKKMKKFYNKYCNEKYIVIHPGGKLYNISRRWKKENFKELIDKIIKEFPTIKIYLTGGKEDIKITEYLIKQCNSENIIDLTGKISFFKWTYLIKKADMCITNDTATMHITSSFNINTYVIMGPTSEKILIAPNSSINIIASNVKCRPCWTYSFKYDNCPNNYICFTKMTKDIVFNKIYSDLKEIR